MPALTTFTLEAFLRAAETPETLADRLETAFVREVGERRLRPGEENRERTSWRNSLPALAHALQGLAGRDIGVLLEYTLPGTNRRVDVLLCGLNAARQPCALVIELKQWTEARRSDDNPAQVRAHGKTRLHPGNQVHGYMQWLAHHHEKVAEGIDLRGAVYLHNADVSLRAHLQSGEAKDRLRLFFQGEEQTLSTFVRDAVGHGGGEDLLASLDGGGMVQTPELMDMLVRAVEGDGKFTLLDDQEAVVRQVISAAREREGHLAVVISGRPGSGKTAIGLHLIGWAARQARREGRALADVAVYTTRGAALRTNLQAALDAAGFPAHGSVVQDVRSAVRRRPRLVVCDETQRLTVQDLRALFPAVRAQDEESRIVVVFQDDRQRVRPDEVGTREAILAEAEGAGWRTVTFDLNLQFRCAKGWYVEWVDHLLYHQLDGDPPPESREGYDLRVVDSPEELDAFCDQAEDRLVAGFTWRWGDPRNGRLPLDVVMGPWRKPWNAKGFDHPRNEPGTHPYTLWATRPYGVTQTFEGAPPEVGCIYSAQGFDFRRCGVILGPDLVIRDGRWVARPEKSMDGPIRRLEPSEDTLRLLLNTYRVLLTRARSGTAIYVHDPDPVQRAETVAYLECFVQG